ncbi:MAG: flagellar hook-associated protein FlgL [Terriglobales bacterium]
MRVNPDMSGDMLAAIWQTQSQENTALQQISSGKRVNVPSDDPLAAAQMVGNQDQSNRADQYLQNIDTLTSQLQTADTAVGSAVAAITQAITLGVQGSTGTLSDANRQQIVQNLLGIQSQLVQLANTSVGGSYLFGGTASTAPPYALDSTSPSGVTYNGNSGTNMVQVAEGLNLQTNMPGNQLFQNSAGDVFGSLQQLITALQSGTPDAAGTATNQLRTAFDSLTGQRIFYGNAVNQLTSTQTFLQQEQVTLKSQANNLVGADLTKAATDLTRATTAHDAALAAAAKILPTSLLDYLK